MDRIQRVSTVLAHVVTIGIILLIAGFAGVWWIDDLFDGMMAQTSLKSVEAATLPIYLRATGFMIAAVPLVIYIFSLFQVRALFRGYARDEVFTKEAAGRLRLIGGALVVSVPVGIVAGSLVSIILTAANAVGERQLAISFGSQEFGALVFGGLLLVVGWVMGEAARLAQENRQFV